MPGFEILDLSGFLTKLIFKFRLELENFTRQFTAVRLPVCRFRSSVDLVLKGEMSA